jgi:outer membrane biosynthesis protein TonB
MQKQYVALKRIMFAQEKKYFEVGDILAHDAANGNKLTVYRNGELVMNTTNTQVSMEAMHRLEMIEEIKVKAAEAVSTVFNAIEQFHREPVVTDGTFAGAIDPASVEQKPADPEQVEKPAEAPVAEQKPEAPAEVPAEAPAPVEAPAEAPVEEQKVEVPAEVPAEAPAPVEAPAETTEAAAETTESTDATADEDTTTPDDAAFTDATATDAKPKKGKGKKAAAQA